MSERRKNGTNWIDPHHVTSHTSDMDYAQVPSLFWVKLLDCRIVEAQITVDHHEMIRTDSDGGHAG